jgi:pyruvate-ferredoxin/flavodoxin oxidoreductase
MCLRSAEPGGTFLLNSPLSGGSRSGTRFRRQYSDHHTGEELKFYVINAMKVARDAGMGGRINTIMQPCFFALTKVLPEAEAMDRIREAIHHTYGKRGEAVVRNEPRGQSISPIERSSSGCRISA